jgi:serine protease Do
MSLKYMGIVAAMTAAFSGGYYYRVPAPVEVVHAISSPAVKVTSQQRGCLSALPDFTEIVSRQGPAVVNISVLGTVKTGTSIFHGFPQLAPDDPLFEFFRRFQPAIPEESESPVHALGSGFIVGSDGVILTNAHVVDGADEVTVKLTDKREFKAKVVGVDKVSDVAVLKIKASNLPIVKIGDPQAARVGEWVVAIGSPFGFENSVTAGIISAKSRALPDEGYVPFLQTDVAVNPGNSGGPLFNLSGEVIGINSQIYSRSGGYQGLSFAIPIDVAMKVEKQLLDHGKVSRGRLGVMVQPVTRELANSFGLDKPAGALVSGVGKDSPAEKAGIEPGDVILKFNGKRIESSEELAALVADTNPGTTAQVEVWHEKKSRTTSVKLGALKAALEELTKSSKVNLGLTVRPLSNEEQKEAEVTHGLIVENVSDGPAARAGIRLGDIILSVNGEKVESVEQLRSLAENSRSHLALLIKRGDSKLFVPIRVR